MDIKTTGLQKGDMAEILEDFKLEVTAIPRDTAAKEKKGKFVEVVAQRNNGSDVSDDSSETIVTPVKPKKKPGKAKKQVWNGNRTQ